jgi:hypothetical protein
MSHDEEPLNNDPIPDDEAVGLNDYIFHEVAARGAWVSPRAESRKPEPPYPALDNAMLKHLCNQFWRRIAAGEHDRQLIFMDAMVNCWYEGHIEGYDRAQREVRADVRP